MTRTGRSRPVVFLVDDHEPNVRLLERIFLGAGIADTRGFTDASAALAAVTADEPDLILLDMHMPRFGGFEFLTGLRPKVASEDFLPVLVVTADVDRATRQGALRAGASDFLTKPIDADEVLARCENLLRTRRLHRALMEQNGVLTGELDERTSMLQQARRERDAIIASLAELGAGDTLEASAGRICGELIRSGDFDAASIIQLTPVGDAVPIASVGLTVDGSTQFRSLTERATRQMRRQAESGPWLEERVGQSRNNPYRAQLEAAGAASAVYAPMDVGGTVVGVVIGVTKSEQSADLLAERLPSVIQYAVVASAVLGPMLASGVERTQARRDIEAIIEKGAMRAVFQPIVSLRQGDRAGFEALTRFADGTPPDRRFAQAESVDLGPELEFACLAEALRSAEGLPRSAFLSLNVSPRVILASGELGAIIDRSDRSIVLEVTEHSPVEDYDELRNALARLGPNVRLAIDDAGAGFASLRHILELAPQFVKLDIGLVRGIDADPARQALVAGMEHFAARTNAILIAEGIETPEERGALIELRVSLGQGYLLGKPAPAGEWPARAMRTVPDPVKHPRIGAGIVSSLIG